MKMNKKGVLDQFLPMVTALVGFGIALAVGFLIVSEIAANDTVTADTNASAALTSVENAMDDIPGWVPIIIVALIGALLLGLVRYFRT